MRVHQPGSSLMRERGAEVDDWSWGKTPPAARAALAADEAVPRPHGVLGRLAAHRDRDRARAALPREVRARRRGPRPRRQAASIIVVGIFVAAGLANWGMTYVETYFTGWVGERILADLRMRLFGHLQRLSLGFYERNRAGVIISRLTNDVEAIDQLVTDGVTSARAEHADAARHRRSSCSCSTGGSRSQRAR